jgi:hypothetical protein
MLGLISYKIFNKKKEAGNHLKRGSIEKPYE